MVLGPLLPSPVIRTRDLVAIQSRQRVRCRCRSRWHYAICAIFLNNTLGLFYHRHIVFFTISLVKNTKCYLSKKSASEWPRNKLLARNYLLSSSKRLQLPNRSLPLWNQFKSALGAAGNRSSPPWALTFVCNSGSTYLLKCSFQIQGVSAKSLLQLENSLLGEYV